MTAQESFREILSLFYQRLASDPQARAAMRRVERQTATFTDTAQLSERASVLLGEVFGERVLDVPEELREAVCTALLRERYDTMNGILADVQEAADEALGLSLDAAHAPFPAERVQTVAHSLIDPGVTAATIQRRANKPVATVARSFHDDFIETNAKKRSDLGLRCHITRETDGKCCPWCDGLAGRYVYGRHPGDIFRRHDNCGCTVTYEEGRQRQDVWTKRSWERVDPEEVAAASTEPTVFSREDAAAMEESLLSGLTLAGERDIMDIGRGSGRGVSDNGHTFEKIGELDPNDKNAVAASLAEFEHKYKDSQIEHCRVITTTGEVYEVHGDRYTVDTSLLGDLMRGSTNEHNHVTGESQYSFSWEDLIGCVNDSSGTALAFDEKYRYHMIFPDVRLDSDTVYEAYDRAKESVGNDLIFKPETISEGDEQHERIRRACEELGIKYSRKELSR